MGLKRKREDGVSLSEKEESASVGARRSEGERTGQELPLVSYW
jgi:hypothetical protein